MVHTNLLFSTFAAMNKARMDRATSFVASRLTASGIRFKAEKTTDRDLSEATLGKKGKFKCSNNLGGR